MSANTTASPEVVKLSSLVSDASDEDIPRHLLEIGTLLQRYPENSKQRQSLKQELLQYDLLSRCCSALNYTFVKMTGGIETAVSLVKIVFDCCVGLSFENSSEFSRIKLPHALQRALYIAWKIQEDIVEKAKYIGSVKYGARADQLAALKVRYRSVLDDVVNVITSHPYLVDTLLKSDNLLRLIIEEDEVADEAITAALIMLLRGVRLNELAVRNMASSVNNDLLNELIYKVTTSKSDDVATVVVKVVLAMIDADPDLAAKMSVRFKGLKALLTRWMNHGFNHTLQRLITILDTGNAQIADLARRTHAVRTIWAAYKGWKTRTRVKKLHKAIPSLQNSFRCKRQRKMESELLQRLRVEQERSNELQRKRSMRNTREKQLHMLEIVPAKKLHSHIQNEEEKAAVRIQSKWRSSTQRKKYARDKHIDRECRAAMAIQRAFRKFLARKNRDYDETRLGYTLHTKLTKERREQLETAIKQRQVIRNAREMSLEEVRAIHDATQKSLIAHHRRKISSRQIEDAKVSALLAKVHTEQEILQSIPPLKDATWDDIKDLACSSTAITMAAEREHRRMLTDLTSSWWQKLSLKPGENLNPFDDKTNPTFDPDLDEVEAFLNPRRERDVLF